jgi:hypothetical protein
MSTLPLCAFRTVLSFLGTFQINYFSLLEYSSVVKSEMNFLYTNLREQLSYRLMMSSDNGKGRGFLSTFSLFHHHIQTRSTLYPDGYNRSFARVTEPRAWSWHMSLLIINAQYIMCRRDHREAQQ